LRFHRPGKKGKTARQAEGGNNMRAVDIILKKRYGHELTAEEIRFVVSGCVTGEIPDYQLSALLMAICFQGMSRAEIANLTTAMEHSGDVVDLSQIPGIKVDKHSTGGVGDTTTLILAPLVAACGVPVAKMSGRGLGHTGGTLDKLESVAGVRVDMDTETFIQTVNRTGIAVIGQSENLVPADKILYALRDVTGTVDSIPLIASSIMSKKLAAGSDAIVLDVKTGSGAFMKDPKDAMALAKVMVEIGDSVGRRTVALITDMSQPLGRAVGNALELREAILALKGEIPEDDNLMKVALALGERMLLLGGAAKSAPEAREKLLQAKYSGAGLEKLRQLLVALGGNGRCCDAPDDLLTARHAIPLKAEEVGYVLAMDTLSIGEASLLLGAGRNKKTDAIDPAVGIVVHVRLGDRVETGDSIATVYANDEAKANSAIQLLREAIEIGQEAPKELPPLIYGSAE
jgi:pyrimidine-nucleoside phosphorylase